ncbi:MAG: DHH family phosphoesterase [Promethearchaeota archaeon]
MSKNQKVKILSLSHGEDLDGVGAQSIIYRYFMLLHGDLLKIFKNETGNNIRKIYNNDPKKNNNNPKGIELVRELTDYDKFLYKWALILACNYEKIERPSDIGLDFLINNVIKGDKLQPIKDKLLSIDLENKTKTFLEASEDIISFLLLYQMILSFLKDGNVEFDQGHDEEQKIANLVNSMDNIIENLEHYGFNSSKLDPQIIRSKITELSGTDIIIMTDMGPNDSFKYLYELLKITDFEFIYIDHHEHSEEEKKIFRQKFAIYIHNPIKSSGQMTCEFLLPNDEVSKRLAELTYDTDYNSQEGYKYDESKILQPIISYNFQFNKYHCLFEIEEDLSKGNFNSEKFHQMYRETVEFEKQEFEYMKENLVYGIFYFRDRPLEIIIGTSKLAPSRNVKLLEELRREKSFRLKLSANYSNLLGLRTVAINKNNDNDPPRNNEGHAQTLADIDYLLIGICRLSGKTVVHSNKINVAKMAKLMNGGGHIDRAGFSLDKRTFAYIFNDLLRLS